MINSVFNIEVNSIRLETQQLSNNIISNEAFISVSYSTESDLVNIDRMNFRLFVSLDPGLSKTLDYISQRYNEYMVLNPSGVSSYRYNRDLQSLLGPQSIVLRSSDPFSPYSTNMDARNLVITNRVSSYADGANVPSGIIMYDAPLKEVTNSIKNGVGLLDPIKITLPESNTPISQMSVYAYVYDTLVPNSLSDQREENFSLLTGMSLVSSVVPLGTKTLYLPTSPQNYILPPQEESTQSRPNENLLTIVSKESEDSANQEFNTIAEKSQQFYSTYQKTKNYELKKVLNNRNYFSDLWLTKDSDDNHRFVFAFDVRSYLYDNGIFPFVYSNQELSNAVIQGGRRISPESLSSVVSVKVYRNYVSDFGSLGTNNLGTTGKNVVKGPSEHFPTVPVADVKQINLNLISDNQLGQDSNISFFEGYDDFLTSDRSNGQIDGVYQYSVEVTVVDHSPKLLRNVISLMSEAKRITRVILNDLTNRPNLIDKSSGNLAEDINRLQVYYDEKNQNISNLLIQVSRLYDQYSSSFGDGSQTTSSLQGDLSFNDGKISLNVIRDLEKKVDNAISSLSSRVEKVFHHDPTGNNVDIGKNNFNFNSSRSNLNNILTTEHTFLSVYRKGKFSGYGLDYLFADESGQESLKSISIEELQNRRVEEFRKYFNYEAGGGNIIPDGSFSDPSYSYMTAKTVKVPNRNAVDQTKYSTENSTAIEYDYQQYSQLFSDIVSLNGSGDKEGLYRSIDISNTNKFNFNNGVYSSINRILGEKFGVSINEVVIPQFSSPQIIKDGTRSTIYNLRDRENCGPNPGLPLLQSVIGGENTQDTTTQSYLDSAGTKIKDEDSERSKGAIDSEAQKQDRKERAIKLPFAILGELTLDKPIHNLSTTEKDVFNSLTELRKLLNLSTENIEDSIENTFINEMPNQIKSMLVFSTTNNASSFGSVDGEQGFDACRPRMQDTDNGEQVGDLISFYNNQEQIPPYPQTEDPMKSYAKFLAFWMNYRQIAVVEYLNNFGDLKETMLQGQDIDSNQLLDRKLKLPNWSKLDAATIDSLSSQGGSILCRVRLMGSEDYLQLVEGAQLSESQKRGFVEYFQTKDMLDLPTYNQYFYINAGNLQNTPQQDLDNLEQQTSFVLGY